MMISGRNLSKYQILLVSAFSLGIFLRFLQLGVRPLTDHEARLALQALDLANGNSINLDPSPGYILLTAINFFLFGSSNFLARFWPALVGASLVCFPIAFKKQLGMKTVVILSFALAIDPGLIAISRIAGDQMLALGFLGLFFAALYSKQFQIAGVMVGLALLSGSPIWFGLLGISVSWALILRVQTRNKSIGDSESYELPWTNKESLNEILIWGLSTFLLVGTLCMFVPNGLSAWAGSLALFIEGFWFPFPIQGWSLWPVLLVYELFALLAGLLALGFAVYKNERGVINIGILAFVFLFFVSIYPSHQVENLVWFLVPLWVLAAIGLSRFLDSFDVPIFKEFKYWVVAVVIFVILVFLYLNFKSLPAELGNPTIIQSRILLIAGGFILVLLTLFLVSAVWNEKISQAGLVLGGLAALTLFTISNAVSASGIKSPDYNELWQPHPQFTGSELLLDTIDDISKWRFGQKTELEVVILAGMNDPSLLWLLRDYKVKEMVSLPMDSSPDLVIHSLSESLSLTDSYLDQDFEIHRTPFFADLTIEGWLRWVLNRDVPFSSDQLVLSVRADILPVNDSANGQ